MTTPTPDVAAPHVFVSYSHDSQVHKNWVLTLATRLVANGVDIILDQWDVRLGSDLPRFMEMGLIRNPVDPLRVTEEGREKIAAPDRIISGPSAPVTRSAIGHSSGGFRITGSDRVLAICTAKYVAKANAGSGGVGYEKMILTAQLMQDVTTTRIVPVVRDNGPPVVMPTFLGGRAYIDFRDDALFEARYAELLRDLHGVHVSPRPPLGPNPFLDRPLERSTPILSQRSERYVAPALSGRVTFDYSNNNGRFVLGAGDMLFETAWSSGGRSSIHAYTDPPSIRTVALVTDTRDIGAITDASS